MLTIDASEATQNRAWSAGVELMPSLGDLVNQSDYILSIVPPRDALETAKRIVHAIVRSPLRKSMPIYYVDLNATSPRTAVETARLFQAESVPEKAVLVDGGIIGGVPYPRKSNILQEEDTHTEKNGADPDWHCPTLIVSGAQCVPDPHLTQILRINHIADTIGAATGVKMCYAALTKGFVSLAIQSFTTAHNLGVLPELRGLLKQYNPSTLQLVEKGLVTMPPKAYRWVHEMYQIGETMAQEGGFENDLWVTGFGTHFLEVTC
jgi:hypothetical protein